VGIWWALRLFGLLDERKLCLNGVYCGAVGVEFLSAGQNK
jgi:hypothetical protein